MNKLQSSRAGWDCQRAHEVWAKEMIQLMVLLDNRAWKNEHAPNTWRERAVVSGFKKGGKTYSENNRGVRHSMKSVCKLLNDSIVKGIEGEG